MSLSHKTQFNFTAEGSTDRNIHPGEIEAVEGRQEWAMRMTAMPPLTARQGQLQRKKMASQKTHLMELHTGVKCASDNSAVTLGVVLSVRNENLQENLDANHTNQIPYKCYERLAIANKLTILLNKNTVCG